MSQRITVLIADDTDIAREGLRRILAGEADMDVVGEGTTLHDTIQKACLLHPDILLLDLKWYGDENAGIEAIKRLKLEIPQTKIIAITVYPALIEPARLAGAMSALTKEVPKRQLIEEIRSVHSLPATLPPMQPARVSPIGEEISSREREVLTLMAEGKTDKEIASALGIAESTAKNHVSNILAKLSVSNRAGAVALGYERGLIGTTKR